MKQNEERREEETKFISSLHLGGYNLCLSVNTKEQCSCESIEKLQSCICQNVLWMTTLTRQFFTARIEIRQR